MVNSDHVEEGLAAVQEIKKLLPAWAANRLLSDCFNSLRLCLSIRLGRPEDPLDATQIAMELNAELKHELCSVSEDWENVEFVLIAAVAEASTEADRRRAFARLAAYVRRMRV